MTADFSPAIVITGASAGIGLAFVRRVASDGRVLVLIARTPESLAAAATMARAEGAAAHILALDVAAGDANAKLGQFLEQNRLYCDVLIANAGFGVLGPAWEVAPARQIELIDVNVRALSEQALAFLPGMVKRGRGGVILVASTASFFPGPYMAFYYASKAFVRSLGEALHSELRGSGVTVSTLCPGPVRTEFFKRAGIRNELLFKLMPRTSADNVADLGWRGFLAGRRLIIPGIANQLVALSAGFLPRGLTLRAISLLQRQRSAP